jgi:hypothetical protein
LLALINSDGSITEETKEVTGTCKKGTKLCETGTGSASDKSSTALSDFAAMLPSIDSKPPSIIYLILYRFLQFFNNNFQNNSIQ